MASLRPASRVALDDPVVEDGRAFGVSKLPRLFLTTLIFFGLATGAQSQEAARFDLECDMTQQSFQESRAIEPRQLKLRFRIDLSRKVWCSDDCPNVGDIGEVTNSQIHLLNPLTDGIRINRVTGALSTTPRQQWGRTFTLSGQCRRAPYTAIPEKAF